jgi:thiol-disulfide isomerase/thioredoxin
MRHFLVFGYLGAVSSAFAQSPVSKMWSELEAKREALPGFHQEFQITQGLQTVRDRRSTQRRVVVDVVRDLWRERTVSGSGDRIRIFDGTDIFLMEDSGDEYVRVKRSKTEDPSPGPYKFGEFDWAKAAELERRPCGLSTPDHMCVILQIPLKRWVRPARGNRMTTMLEGVSQFAMDMETGLLVQSKTSELIDNQRASYRTEVTYSLKNMNYGIPADPSLFKLPVGELHEVKELTRWNAARIKKELVGRPAPELEATDMRGNPVSLTTLKGKTVLLDFWATWCPPCRADSPALEKLNKKYGDKELAIISLSVNEERDVVEKFIKEHPHDYPVVLTAEADVPRPYQVRVIPTYVVIDQDGKVTFAVEGDQGFGELRKLLKKSGMDAD